MKLINIFVITLLFLSSAMTIFAQDFEEINVPLSNPNEKGFLKVEIHKGPIAITGTNRKDILIRYAAFGKSEKATLRNAKNGLKKLTIASIDLEISESDNRIKVNSDDWNRGLILEIEVPKTIDLKIESYNQGNLEIDNIEGNLELTSYNGSITATQISGSVIADTYNGKITVAFDRVQADEPMAFTNYNDGLDLTFPPDVKATFKINNKQGDVYTGFDMEMEKQKIEKKQGKKSFKVQVGKWVVGKVNGGGAEITMENYNGDIYIRKTE
ncbi:MAG: hypothetical protein AB8H03_21810 [Saprospiraceae bacterium]